MKSWAWASRAACAGLTDLMTMPRAGRSRPAEIAAAKDLCHICPVFLDCRHWVLSMKPDPTPQMITAGLTPEERSEARRQQAFYADPGDFTPRRRNIGRTVAKGA